MVLIVNDKIESLLYLSGLTSQGCWDKLDEWDREAVLKFAELIVRECAQFIFVLDAEPVSHKSAARLLQEYFGVK